LCDFTDFFLSANTSADFYSWSNGETGDSIQISIPGIYSVEVSNICGTSSDTIVITPCGAVYLVPTAFSPNGDGTNDLLSLIKIGNASLINFIIFNRWGEIIFQTKNESQGWNGTYKGLEEEIGVFVFLLKYRDNDSGKELTAAGNITLIR
jgi:gliding motility-associated-like protein